MDVWWLCLLMGEVECSREWCEVWMWLIQKKNVISIGATFTEDSPKSNEIESNYGLWTFHSTASHWQITELFHSTLQQLCFFNTEKKDLICLLNDRCSQFWYVLLIEWALINDSFMGGPFIWCYDVKICNNSPHLKNNSMSKHTTKNCLKKTLSLKWNKSTKNILQTLFLFSCWEQ